MDKVSDDPKRRLKIQSSKEKPDSQLMKIRFVLFQT